ncbi:MAG: FtsQ-type POTRA domain-containing protein [Parcubacteria group bacterium]|jgi:hypothetical protein
MIVRKQNSKVVRSSREKKETAKKEKNPKKWFFVLMVIIFVCSVGYVLFYSPVTEISHIAVEGSHRTDAQNIINGTQDTIAGEIFGRIKRNNYFFLNTSDIIKKISEDQRIKSVVIKKVFPDTIVISVEEYALFSVWCIGSEEGACYELADGCVVRSVDMNSALIQQNDHFVVVDKARDHVDIGQCVILQKDLDTIAYLGKELIYTLNVGIVQPYFIDVRGSREIRFVTDESWQILASLESATKDTLDTAKLFAHKVALPVARNDLEYVDLRFAGKIFYKFKDGVEIQEDTGEKEKEQKEALEIKEEKINDAHD